MKTSIFLAIAILFLGIGQGFGATYFNDGGTHNINYSESYVYVDQGAPGMNTTVNLLNGGSIWKWWAYEDSRINISGGSVGLWLVPYGRTQVTMSGGITWYLYAYDSSKVTMSGGTATGDLVARGSSQVTLSGGTVMGFLDVGESSRLTMSGGSVSGLLGAGGNSQVTLSGGTIAQTLDLYQNAILYLDGNNFAIDGAPFTSGEITSVLGGSYENESYRRLTGTLANGTIINNQFRIGNTAKIVLVPKPTVPPIADAGPDQTVMDSDDNGSEQVTLYGSGSSDTDGNILSWVWTDNLGGTIPDGEIIIATLSVGTHTITLTVTDNDGLTDTDTVTVTVEPYPNQPPFADADGPYTIYVDDTLTLDASGSTDADNDIVSYLWDLDDNGSFETNADSNAIFTVNFTYLQSIGLLVDNTYNIHLKVTDSKNHSDTANSTLTIIPQPALQVAVDIKPGSCPNPLNVKSSGVLPVAILGTNDVNVITIDPTSIRLAGVKPLRSGLEDVAGLVADSNNCNCSETGPDGFLDLTLKFKTQEIADSIGDVNDGDILVLELAGVLFDEKPIEGSDCILILDKHKPFNKADFNRDGKVDMADFAAFAENWLQSSVVED